jgi:hypothetical protein
MDAAAALRIVEAPEDGPALMLSLDSIGFPDVSGTLTAHCGHPRLRQSVACRADHHRGRSRNRRLCAIENTRLLNELRESLPASA